MKLREEVMGMFICCECGIYSDSQDGCCACDDHQNGTVCEDCMTDEQVEEMLNREDEP